MFYRVEDVVRGHVILGLLVNDDFNPDVLFDKSEFKASKEVSYCLSVRVYLPPAYVMFLYGNVFILSVCLSVCLSVRSGYNF